MSKKKRHRQALPEITLKDLQQWDRASPQMQRLGLAFARAAQTPGLTEEQVQAILKIMQETNPRKVNQNE